MSAWPKDYRITLAVIAAAFVAMGWAETRVRSVARAQAVEVVDEDRGQFKKDALEAARAGAAQAVRESVTPVMVEVREHRAKDEQAQHETDRRLETLERNRR